MPGSPSAVWHPAWGGWSGDFTPEALADIETLRLRVG
jgi:hypothetical protein